MSASLLSELIGYVQEHYRVCPRPVEWIDLYERIGGTRHDTSGGIIWEPVPPLVLSAWNFSNDDERKKRFHEQLTWASGRNTLLIADQFLRSLSEEAWHHRLPTKPTY